MSFAARARRSSAANDTIRAQINNIPEKSYVIIIIINKHGQMISRMRVLIIPVRVLGVSGWPFFDLTSA